MTNQPPVPGAGDPAQPPAQPPVPPPPGPPPGFPPPQAPPTAPLPQQPQNPYPPAPPAPPSQPVWQGHQAPQQGWGAYAAPTPPKKSRKGLLIGLVVLLVLLLVGGAIALAMVLVSDDDKTDAGLEVSELKQGQCLTSDSLKDGEFDEITGLTDVDCDDDHDVEVFAMLELEDDESLGDVGARCVIEASDMGRPQFELADDDLEIRPLVGSEEPEEGDDVACFVRHQDGERQSGSAFDDSDSEEEDE